jgi:hypothetical protein
MSSRLVTYKGLKKLALELLSFDIEDVKERYLEILQIHSDSLTHLSLARNKISNIFMQIICDTLRTSLPNLQCIDLRHLKETDKINWPKMLSSIAVLASKERAKPIKVIVSDYQTQKKRSDIFNYLQDNQPNIELQYD